MKKSVLRRFGRPRRPTPKMSYLFIEVANLENKISIFQILSNLEQWELLETRGHKETEIGDKDKTRSNESED